MSISPEVRKIPVQGGEVQKKSAQEIQEANGRLSTAIVCYILDTSPIDPTEEGVVWQRTRARRTDGSGRSYALAFINHTRVETSEQFVTSIKDDRDRLIIVLVPALGEEGYDSLEKTAKHELLALNESRIRGGLTSIDPYPDVDLPAQERAYERVRKYGEILTDIVGSLGIVVTVQT